jgi:hypothetical protein
MVGAPHQPLLRFGMDCLPATEFGRSLGPRLNILSLDFNQFLRVNIGTDSTQNTVSLHSTEKNYCSKSNICLAT